ncbi:LacI family DNA-binding transcriptional regulator [Paenibacillus sp. GD4]|jgi:DNA-binding LacI/PurR family transcriptional regulator|uniref:LacI family DNA-binding transcriptional regulator n=1 Tax=Paenibacillus sp. GD4 TaxID=3068890 RepID=UPI0027964F1C|nr:LacI family DNA-binding transcriptional regulator [Paenibacillus sp. GD4]MDQ1914859.1 LacI family DNA-binding transcriptional regulator [Paenibacillus sp. GD4]
MKIEDIAKLANVSKSAVSLAINGKPGVSEETRNKILDIVRNQGYVPRSTRTEKISTTGNSIRFVACVHEGIILEHYNQQPFFMELIHYLEEKCRKRGLVLLFNTVPAADLEDKIEELEQEHESGGIILLGTNLSREQVQMIAARHKNLVVLDTCHNTLNAHFIVMNNMMGAYQAAQHLVSLGHKSIGYVQSNVRMHNFNARKEGFINALHEVGLDLAEKDLFTISPTIVSSQPEFTSAIRSRNGDLPSALFCECDYIAISVIKSFMELGIRVPHDISVVGFDNIHEAVVISPELTTIHVEKEAIAETAVSKLLDLMENEGSSITTKIHIDTRLVVRNSTSSFSNSTVQSLTKQ